MYTTENFFRSVPWFGFGLVANRIKYILLTIIVFQLGTGVGTLYYISLHLINEITSFISRLISAASNRFLRDSRSNGDDQKLRIVNSSIILSVIFGVISAVIVFSFSRPLALFFKNDSLTQIIQLFSLAIPFMVINQRIHTTLSVMTRYKSAVLFHNVIEMLFVLIPSWIVIFILKADLYTLLIWQVTATMLSSFILLLLLRKVIHPFGINFMFLSRPKISSIIFFNVLAIASINMVDIFTIGFYLGIEKLGLYIAMLVGPRLIYATSINTFGMFIHTAVGLQNPRKINILAKRVLMSMLCATIPTMLILFMYPQEVIHSILRIHSQVDPVVVRLLSLAFFVKAFGWLAGQVLVALKASRDNMKTNMLLSILAMILLVAVTPKYGLTGVAFVLVLLSLLEVTAKTILLRYRDRNSKREK